MLSKIKYRFIGGIVLIALIIIFAPMFFHSMVRYQSVKPVKRPALPAVTVAKAPAKLSITPPSSAIKQSVQPFKAYAIQVASFKEKSRVDALLASLTKEGLKGYAYKPQASHFTRVYVGPFITKEKAKRLLTVLEKQYKLKGLIKPYNPQKA